VSDATLHTDAEIALHTPAHASRAKDFVALLKPRVMTLVVFTGFVGLYLAPGHLHPLIAGIAVFCIAVAAGAAGAINMWYDRDIDAVMRRTQGRPLPQGRIDPDDALAFGILLSIGAVGLMALAVNVLAAVLLAGSILFYVFVYTIWLKRSTPQNIVIGGAAGAFPPVIGWAAVTGSVGLAPLALFLLVFLWTPPHFWALALYRSGEYGLAGVPMMPVVAGPRATKRQMLLYTLMLAPVAMAPVALGFAGWLYGIVAATVSLLFILCAVLVLREADDAPRQPMARRMFAFSLLHLTLIFAALLIDAQLA
jgi:protoheme IX farnesyltransferase